MWFYEPDQNLTVGAYTYFSSIRGTVRGDPAPKTGFRTRREYRMLSDQERARLHDAFNQLYEVSETDDQKGLSVDAAEDIGPF